MHFRLLGVRQRRRQLYHYGILLAAPSQPSYRLPQADLKYRDVLSVGERNGSCLSSTSHGQNDRCEGLHNGYSLQEPKELGVGTAEEAI